jgi:hypothetical protein
MGVLRGIAQWIALVGILVIGVAIVTGGAMFYATKDAKDASAGGSAPTAAAPAAPEPTQAETDMAALEVPQSARDEIWETCKDYGKTGASTELMATLVDTYNVANNITAPASREAVMDACVKGYVRGQIEAK